MSRWLAGPERPDSGVGKSDGCHRSVLPCSCSGEQNLPWIVPFAASLTGKSDVRSRRSSRVVPVSPQGTLSLGIDCSILEVQKLGWFVERGAKRSRIADPLRFMFQANRHGPCSHNLTKLLDSLDGTCLRCDKRLADAGPFDLIWFGEARHDRVQAYLNSGEGKVYSRALEWASNTVDGFESPLGMELLATVDWMIQHDGTEPTVNGVIEGLMDWPGGREAGQRKSRIFDRRLVSIALEQLETANRSTA